MTARTESALPPADVPVRVFDHGAAHVVAREILRFAGLAAAPLQTPYDD